MKIDMLEVSGKDFRMWIKDKTQWKINKINIAIKEIDKQIKKACKCNYAINLKPLYDEKRDLLQEIKDIESKRGVTIGK